MTDLPSIYRDKSPSLASKSTLATLHFGIVLAVVWLLFGGGISRIDHFFGIRAGGGAVIRRMALMSCAVLYFLRTLATVFVFVKRRMSWAEVGTIAGWIATIDLLIAFFGGRNGDPFGRWGVTGACLVLVGSTLNSGSEWQRQRWKSRPENAGHLLTRGLFRLARHINYFGDVVLFTGWVMVAGRFALLMIPLAMLSGFIWVNVPAQDRYLEERYGNEYQSYAKRTARLIPFLY